VASWLTHLELDWQSPVWTHWFRELAKDHRLVRYDSRGTGLSDRVAGELSVDAWVSDLEAVVDDLGLERFALFGFCQGGPVAISFAARHPERVSHLVLYDSYAAGRPVRGRGEGTARRAEVLAEMIEVGWGTEVGAFREVFANLLFPGATREQQRWLGELQRRTVSPTTAVHLWRAFVAIDVRAEAERIEVPTLVLHVRGDAMVPFEAGRRLAALIPDSRFVPLEGENHILLPGDEAWPRFLEEVRRFLRADEVRRSAGEIEARLVELTDREREVLSLVGRGLTNEEIAERLSIAPKTVRNHVSRIYDKVGARSRAQAVVLAREARLRVR
jgi:pimeloyl-ACP methyl ester carboxylesterase/DNA-binding CsgD family transcriptional regulator